ncbi:hypothetical protein CLAFUW4_14050 [Fulvia fulva]|uniref:Uncharacterized protein n=1 Tax=Passalora fulva TaxID=5499 RepID=A0A9Q8PLE2_PASFU|nr:uncharacterized protein CLAFUR5_13887 [Fulvia fulva]KAK4610275.1 hypothetical protein CLAFUR4_14053 [Fulvia fulva]KAK4611099.1 hypothetical protein CLAFUR0_14057 [Fulvia fulva]UJO24618.1 hypothetical protein CLAFUR5_13887 [Fulvia fulva]WPV21773.1 hypothetical protein CLAFUW4_14050 [Fulvia fulva]WPV36911.1 hypothetical protein CLAFUW7_14061 [Fulvia fulva]
MPECTIHLISLVKGIPPEKVINQLLADHAPVLLKGIPHGWVHQPHDLNKSELLSQEWDLFMMLPGNLQLSFREDSVPAHVSINVSLGESQFEKLLGQASQRPTPSSNTPPLPVEWPGTGSITQDAIVETQPGALKPGELHLDSSMAKFLSSALPTSVANAPVSFFNLFKYSNNDRSAHDSYMDGFKQSFGSTAGASVKFMGPVASDMKHNAGNGNTSSTEKSGERWDEANLTQYDSVWHYAYMLSTTEYKGLNQQKVAGLQDTCILLVSEMELAETT